MNEREHPADAPLRGGLKSLLKKPGQTRGRSHKNRVVINEKLNEFFAADYIILIKEECCADYEEECDCCCQEPEMIRLGNCKECRADMTRNLSNNSNNPGVDPRYGDSRNGSAYASGLDCDPSAPVIRRDHRQPVFGSEESQEEEEDDEDEDEEEEEEEEVDEDEEDDEAEDSEEVEKCERDERVNCNMVNCATPPRVQQQQQQQQQLQRPPQQQETLSPPEGYKDVCDEDATLSSSEQQQQHLVCGECNYYHRQRTANAAAAAADDNNVAIVEAQNGECAEEKELVRHGEDNTDQQTSDQAQQTTPDLHQRYLVETITMTTVTERRIVREISEEETRPITKDEADTTNANEAIENTKNIVERKEEGTDRVRFSDSSLRSGEDNDNSGKSCSQQIAGERDNNSIEQREGNDPSELSLSFKLGNVSLGLTNSLKPNSAVRQLFPDPRFISPPPAPAKAVVGALQDQGPDDVTEAQKFLITTESLRLFDAVKRSKMAGSRSDSSESESSSIKRTIERNALRRSLICKYETSSRKKNLRSKDLTLEERIRQLTCVDQDDDNTGSSASETGVPTAPPAATTTMSSSVDAVDYGTEFPVRTSPSGEERPNRNDARLCASRITTGTNNIQETTTTLVQQSSSTTSSAGNNAHHHHHHHHHHQSTYKRITDLFAQKKMADANLPDIGLGDKAALAKEYSSKSSLSKMNSDARKQFLASLAPLSCVASTGVESREDYYQLSSKQMSSNNNSSSSSGSIPGNRDSIGYNSDSSYSLEDIDAALRGEERNYKNAGGPPDVTRGTPTGSGPETCDATTDELLAFVEQDKSRTERIRRRYNDTEQESTCSASCHRNEDSNFSTVVEGANGGRLLLTNVSEQSVVAEGETATHNGGTNDEDEDDELNDYGFNRRPSVRGIKPQFESTSEIVRQLRSRSAIPSSIAEKSRASFHGAPWPYYEITGESTEKQASTTFLLAAPIMSVEEGDQRSINPDGSQLRGDNNTINRINTMQKQIDDIYQTIAETAVTVTQGTVERGSYLDSTLPRTMPRGAISDSCHRYSHQEQLPAHSQKNGAIHYHEAQAQQQQQLAAASGGRMLRIAGGGDGSPGSTGVYNTLPTKSRRPQTVGIANYPCNVASVPQQAQQSASETTKCYRTMYFVPYNGLSDPTYQNIQRILPPHSSANYADHIERYPYPRNGRVVDQASLQIQHQQQQHSQMGPQPQPPRYYTRAVPGVPGNGTTPSNIHAQAGGLHLHLHAQPEDYRYSTVPVSMQQQQHAMQPPALQIQHHQHLPQMQSYNNVQTVPTYSILATSRPNVVGPPGAPAGYAYPLPHSTSRAPAADVQTQTISLSPPSASATTTCGPAIMNANYNNGTATHLGTASSSSSNSSALSSPTKIQQHQRNSSCNVAERGVPEGAASAPSHDYGQTNSNVSHTMSNTFLGHTNNVPPPNTQNSVYYAMNV